MILTIRNPGRFSTLGARFSIWRHHMLVMLTVLSPPLLQERMLTLCITRREYSANPCSSGIATSGYHLGDCLIRLVRESIRTSTPPNTMCRDRLYASMRWSPPLEIKPQVKMASDNLTIAAFFALSRIVFTHDFFSLFRGQILAIARQKITWR